MRAPRHGPSAEVQKCASAAIDELALAVRTQRDAISRAATAAAGAQTTPTSSNATVKLSKTVFIFAFPDRPPHRCGPFVHSP